MVVMLGHIVVCVNDSRRLKFVVCRVLHFAADLLPFQALLVRTTEASPVCRGTQDLRMMGEMSSTTSKQDLHQYVERSIGRGALAARVVAVLERLPDVIMADFLKDPLF